MKIILFLVKNLQDSSKWFSPREMKTIETFRRREKTNDKIQCYECKWFGHVAAYCANKRKTFKNEVMEAIWDDSSDNSKDEASHSEEDSLRAIKAFVTCTNEQTEKNCFTSEDEDEGNEDVKEAFNKLYMEGLKLAKTNAKLKKENKELNEKFELFKSRLNELNELSMLNSNLAEENQNLDKLNKKYHKEVEEKRKIVETKEKNSTKNKWARK